MNRLRWKSKTRIYSILFTAAARPGSPMGIVHTHYVRGMYCTMFASSFRMRPESVVIHAGSIVFNAFVMLMPAMYLGATYVLQKHFEPESFIAAVEARACDTRDDGAVANHCHVELAGLFSREVAFAGSHLLSWRTYIVSTKID